MTAQEFAEKINDIWTKTKTGKLCDRQVRFAVIERLVDEYIAKNGKRPEPEQLDRLATLCLYEEMKDSHPDKMSREEFPIMSDEQYARRTEGAHVRRRDKDGKPLPNKTEIPLSAAYDYGIDGRNYRQPTRRRLSTDEALHVDKNLPKDVEQRKKYKSFTKPGKVEVRRLGN